MLRTAMRPRWLALLVLVLALATAFAALGSWQLGRAQRDGGASAVPTEPVPIDAVTAPQRQLDAAAVAGPVVVNGTFEPERVLVVVGRELGGRPGGWVVVPLLQSPASGGPVPPGGDSARPGGDPARLAVVLGWTADVDPGSTAARVATALPGGPMEVVGRLQPSEAPAGPGGDLAPGQRASLSSAELVNEWGPPVWSGFLLALSPPAGLEAVPAPEPEGGLELLNVSYAVQWWVFAVFAVFLWWRVVRDAHVDEVAAASAAAAAGHTGGRPEQGAFPAAAPGTPPALRSEHT